MDKLVGIIIQARMGSTRLPGKILKPIGPYLLLEKILIRLKNIKNKVKILVATTCEQEDNKVAEFCSSLRQEYFRGSENDVLSRYYECAKDHSFDHIVRLTADNPFVDIVELDRLIDLHLKDQNDYTHSFGQLPLGVGAEIFTFAALEKSFHFGDASHHREHVNEYIQENLKEFKSGQLCIPRSKSYFKLRLTIDTEEDYKRACGIVKQSDGKDLTTEDIISLCLPSV